MSNRHDIHTNASHWVKEAADNIRTELDNELVVKMKTAPNDLVTNLDVQTEKFLIGKIKDTYPNHKIVSEEGFGDSVQNLGGPVWFVDPIDGTLNFVKQRENFCIMLAYYEDGVGQLAYIYDVVTDRFYHVIKGEGAFCNGKQIEPILERGLDEGFSAFNSKLISRPHDERVTELIRKSLGLRIYGSAGIESMEVISSRTVAYIAMNLKPWDFAPANVFVEELGAKLTDFQNQPVDLLKPSQIIVANQKAHKEIIEIINQ